MGKCSALICCSKFLLKILLFVINILGLLTGIAFIALGGLTYKLNDDYGKYLGGGDFLQYAVVLMAFGIIICVIAIVGLCGSSNESRVLLLVYAVAMAVLALATLVTGCLILSNIDSIEAEVDGNLYKFFEKDYRDSVDAGETMDLKDFKFGVFDAIQFKFKCCGVDGPADYKIKKIYPNDRVPISCCTPLEELEATLNNIRSSRNVSLTTTCSVVKAKETGCNKDFKKFVVDSMRLAGVVSFVIAAVEVLAVIVAVFMVIAVQVSR